MSPPKFLPNLSTDGQENATFEAKNTNPHAPIPKPVHEPLSGLYECLRMLLSCLRKRTSALALRGEKGVRKEGRKEGRRALLAEAETAIYHNLQFVREGPFKQRRSRREGGLRRQLLLGTKHRGEG